MESTIDDAQLIRQGSPPRFDSDVELEIEETDQERPNEAGLATFGEDFQPNDLRTVHSPLSTEGGDINYMALHYASKQESEAAIVDRIVRQTKSRKKTKITPSVLTKPFGLNLLAKRCRQLRKTRLDEGKIQIQLYRVLEMYDDWAKQLCPGHDLNNFYAKVEKFGNDRMVKDLAEELIAARHVNNLDLITPHTSRSRDLIQQSISTSFVTSNNQVRPTSAQRVTMSPDGRSNTNSTHFLKEDEERVKIQTEHSVPASVLSFSNDRDFTIDDGDYAPPPDWED